MSDSRGDRVARTNRQILSISSFNINDMFLSCIRLSYDKRKSGRVKNVKPWWSKFRDVACGIALWLMPYRLDELAAVKEAIPPLRLILFNK